MAGVPVHSEGREMHENGPRSVFDTSREDLDQKNRRQRAEVQSRTLTMEEYQRQLREILVRELRKPPEQRAKEHKEWFERWMKKTRKSYKRILQPPRYKWPSK